MIMVMIIYSETLPYGHLVITATLFGRLPKTAIHILVKKTSLIRPILFGPLVTVLTAFHCNCNNNEMVCKNEIKPCIYCACVFVYC